MNILCNKIGFAKRKLAEISKELDSIYFDVQQTVTNKLSEIDKPTQDISTDRERIGMKIVQRLIYIKRIREKNPEEADLRTDELSRLLDWIEEMN